MLQQLLVALEYPYSAHCGKCKTTLFEVRIIDQLVRSSAEDRKQVARYYLLHEDIQPSSIALDKAPTLNTTRPLYMLYLSLLKCSTCSERVGFKLLSISSEVPNHELLGRLFIEVDKVRIRTPKEDVSDQVILRFEDEWDKDTELSCIEGPESQGESVRGFKEKQSEIYKKTERRQPSAEPEKKQVFRKQEQELKYLRKKVEENAQAQELINELVSSMDFFNEVLGSLEKRVKQAENVCLYVKESVEKIIPLLRKKKQQ